MNTPKMDRGHDQHSGLDTARNVASMATGPIHTSSTATVTPSGTGSITLSDEGQARLVRLSGDINVTLRDQASAVLLQVAMSTYPLIIEMKDVTGIDDTGIAFVYQLAAVEDEGHQPIVLRGAPTDVLATLGNLGIIDKFVIA